MSTKPKAECLGSTTVAEVWLSALSLISSDQVGPEEYVAAQTAVLNLQPMLAMDAKALRFATQGWIAGQRQAAKF